jgi:hypothetical protein
MREHRFEADPSRVVIVLPGIRYTPAHPLLHYARLVALSHQWTVQEIWWDAPGGEVDWVAWVGAAARDAIAAEAGRRVAIVGKSLGTLAIPVAAEQSIPGVWLTPLLGRVEVRAAVRKLPAATLLIGGTTDDTWDSDVARASGLGVHTVTDGDHVLEIAGDPVRSVDALRTVVVAMDQFFSSLGSSPSRGPSLDARGAT